ncbi:MAG: hypothetical protein QG637_331 [Chloroflexota bacterium]|nr:hypothetical protein [Chloroflexota bacterium]
MIYMAGAYLIIWAAAFVFILSMLRRQSKLEAELKALQEMSQEKR